MFNHILFHLENNDYIPVTTDLIFDALTDRNCIQISLLEDSAIENVEQFGVRLTTSSPGALTSPSQADIFIMDITSK